MGRAKAEVLLKRCDRCDAAFKTTQPATRFCPAHRYQRPPAVDDCGGRTWVPYATYKFHDWNAQFLFAHDAANECVHGALPHDRKIPKGCKCWGTPEEGRWELAGRYQAGMPSDYDLGEQRATRAVHEAAEIKPVEKKKRAKRKAA